MISKFEQRKKAILSKKDKSSIGGWDKKIAKLCDKINKQENYYTTSSCAGRIIIMLDQEKKGPGLFEFVGHDLVKELKIPNLKKDLKFKSEPPILHVACRELEDAEKLLKKVRDAGWKRSGIISLGKNIIVEIIGTEKLEFPLLEKGKLLVSKEFLIIVVRKANKNLEKGWDRIDKLREII